jgi:hypothetical protein
VLHAVSQELQEIARDAAEEIALSRPSHGSGEAAASNPRERRLTGGGDARARLAHRVSDTRFELKATDL